MKKTICIALALLLLLSCATAESTRVAALKGPTAMGMVSMMEENADCEFAIYASADEITPKLVQGEIDIAALPANLASVLYNRTNGEIRVLAVNTLGVLYIAERGENIHSVEDLAGKTIYSAGKGSTPEYALNYILTMNGLTPGEDVFIEYKAEHSECLSALLNDSDAVAMLPQPFATTALTKAEDMRIALNLTEEWEKLGSESGLITGVVVARSAFIDENPDAIAAFLDAYAASVQFVNENVSEAAVLVEKYGIVTAAVAEKAIPQCNIVCITGKAMLEILPGYLETLYEQAPESLGGKLPDAGFYYS